MTSYREEDRDPLVREHGVLLRHYGELQRRFSAQAQCQGQEIERLQGQLIRLRAKVIMRGSALAWEREDRRRLLDAITALPEHEAGARREVFRPVPPSPALAPTEASALHSPDANPEWIERSLHSADLVICQTGCVSHGAFWRVEDHCKRTGKTCVLVEQPAALNAVRSHPGGQAERLVPAPLCEKETQ
ncbi:DUF2325 domain-containing protein [Alicycliphilus denitrificans]|uniref:DUF2325 domain-containing protein n=1 Tax=Alicycliphilus denitrificans TaxID=179636 RepID=UPI003A80FFCD